MVLLGAVCDRFNSIIYITNSISYGTRRFNATFTNIYIYICVCVCVCVCLCLIFVKVLIFYFYGKMITLSVI